MKVASRGTANMLASRHNDSSALAAGATNICSADEATLQVLRTPQRAHGPQRADEREHGARESPARARGGAVPGSQRGAHVDAPAPVMSPMTEVGRVTYIASNEPSAGSKRPTWYGVKK